MDQCNHWNHIRWEFFGSISKSSSFALSCHLLLYNWQLEIKWCHTCILNESKKKAKKNNVIQKMNFEKTEFTIKMNYFDPLSYVIFFSSQDINSPLVLTIWVNFIHHISGLISITMLSQPLHCCVKSYLIQSKTTATTRNVNLDLTIEFIKRNIGNTK